MSFADQEYAVLRTTIAQRGTVRVVVAVAVLTSWAGLGLVQMLFSQFPVAALFPLAILAVGFEAVNGLHVGVERIGRYLQVFYEETQTDETVRARWETAAMAGGPALPGSGVDPLFTLLFSAAAVLNLATAFVPDPTTTEMVVVGGIHVALVARILHARVAAGRQRARDLEHYRRLRDR